MSNHRSLRKILFWIWLLFIGYCIGLIAWPNWTVIEFAYTWGYHNGNKATIKMVNNALEKYREEGTIPIGFMTFTEWEARQNEQVVP
jgi:hypothetical protein